MYGIFEVMLTAVTITMTTATVNIPKNDYRLARFKGIKSDSDLYPVGCPP